MYIVFYEACEYVYRDIYFYIYILVPVRFVCNYSAAHTRTQQLLADAGIISHLSKLSMHLPLQPEHDHLNHP
jgi:hypothetical protein